ncbi:MFS multidrug transporter [Aspergillus sclerotialis]|uniref:MFS multidrug transporter n=1 Tax=Aspergillus sclerotialis TaxID=2070753 RepID=A0A3A2ZNS2_9EURO|nr:MFS multidrug transporter [Aspergillus sclerotialis]
MYSVEHQDLEVQLVQEGQNRAVQGSIPRGDDALNGGVVSRQAVRKTTMASKMKLTPRPSSELAKTTNPKEWSSWHRAWALFCIAFSSFIESLYSSIYTSIAGVSKAFDINLRVIRRWASLRPSSALVRVAVRFMSCP